MKWIEPERETRDTDNKNLNEMNKGFLDYNILNFSYQIIDFLLHFFQLFTFYISWNSLRYFLPFMNETSGRDWKEPSVTGSLPSHPSRVTPLRFLDGSIKGILSLLPSTRPGSSYQKDNSFPLYPLHPIFATGGAASLRGWEYRGITISIKFLI